MGQDRDELLLHVGQVAFALQIVAILRQDRLGIEAFADQTRKQPEHRDDGIPFQAAWFGVDGTDGPEERTVGPVDRKRDVAAKLIPDGAMMIAIDRIVLHVVDDDFLIELANFVAERRLDRQFVARTQSEGNVVHCLTGDPAGFCYAGDGGKTHARGQKSRLQQSRDNLVYAYGFNVFGKIF